jgi:hypothetical protein
MRHWPGGFRRSYNKATPVHDSSSHSADALRYLAVSHRSAALKPAHHRPRYLAPSGRAWAGWGSDSPPKGAEDPCVEKSVSQSAMKWYRVGGLRSRVSATP